MRIHSGSSYLRTLVGFSAIGGAWLFPESWFSVALTIVGYWGLLGLFVAPTCSLKFSWLLGTGMYAVGFHWLFGTITNFGGFPWPIGAALFLLFCASAGFQFALSVLCERFLPQGLRQIGMRGSVALILVQSIYPRIFPWELGHTLLPFSALAQSVALGGTTLLAFLPLWLIESADETLSGRAKRQQLILPILAMTSVLLYGWFTLATAPSVQHNPITLSLVQANISIEEKHDRALVMANVERYVELTKTLPKSTELVIWPETVVHEFSYAFAKHVRHAPKIPYLGPDRTLLLGALTFSSERESHNSAVVVWPDGTIPTPYHKQILMPFGEYVPFGDTLPLLRSMSGGILDFTPGRTNAPLPVKLPDTRVIPIGTLICYEDIIPALARKTTKEGAELLVNITNDGWFGDTVAPKQHHLIAAFRAIENRRYLVRSTNSGFSAIVDPYGRTVASVPGYSDETLTLSVDLLKYLTPYTRLDVERVWDIVWLLLGGIAVYNAFRKMVSSTSTGTRTGKRTQSRKKKK